MSSLWLILLFITLPCATYALAIWSERRAQKGLPALPVGSGPFGTLRGPWTWRQFGRAYVIEKSDEPVAEAMLGRRAFQLWVVDAASAEDYADALNEVEQLRKREALRAATLHDDDTALEPWMQTKPGVAQ